MKSLDQDLINSISDILPESMSAVVYPAGVTLFRENDAPGHAYLIERGQIEISRRVLTS